MWLLWKDDLSDPFVLNVVSKSSRFMACSIKYLISNIQFLAIFIYAAPHASEKDEFWLEISSFVDSAILPLLLLVILMKLVLVMIN